MPADSLPFLLMAVDERVLALYYVACAMNGFFQHCDIHLRYGPLNYIVGSAETHRWHHSRVPRESNANYGSTVVVWDVAGGRSGGGTRGGTHHPHAIERLLR